MIDIAKLDPARLDEFDGEQLRELARAADPDRS